MIDSLILSLYLLAWILFYCWYRKQDQQLDGGSFIILTYIGYAFVSILSINNPDSAVIYPYLPLKVWPFVYLMAMLLLALWPAIYHRKHPMVELPVLPMPIVLPICWIFVLCGLAGIPAMVDNAPTTLTELLTNPDAGVDAYGDSLMTVERSGKTLSNLFILVNNTLYDVCVFFLFYLLTNTKRHKLIICLMAVMLVLSMAFSLMRGQRSTVITPILTIGMCYFLFQRYYSSHIRHIAKIVGIVLLILILLPLAALTFSRFSTNKSEVSDSLTWYIGQGNIYFNNYAVDDGGTRQGTRVFNLITRFVNPSAPANFQERREIYSHLKIGDEVFSTFVGDFVIDIGLVWTVVVFLLFNGVVWLLIRHPKSNGLGWQLLLIYMTMCICVQGGMYLFYYSDIAGLRLVAFVLCIAAIVVYQHYARQMNILRQIISEEFEKLSMHLLRSNM